MTGPRLDPPRIAAWLDDARRKHEASPFVTISTDMLIRLLREVIDSRAVIDAAARALRSCELSCERGNATANAAITLAREMADALDRHLELDPEARSDDDGATQQQAGSAR